MDNASPDPSNNDILMVPNESSSELDFGPWILVACRCGRASGRDGSARASHVTPDTVANGYSNGPSSQNIVGGGICGGYRTRGHGGFLVHHAQRSELFKNDLTPSSDVSLHLNTLAKSSAIVISQDSTSAISRDLSSGGHPDQLTDATPIPLC